MSRKRLTIGTFGETGHLVGPGGRAGARARYRDWDDKTRLVQATGDTRKSAERVLKAKLADRSLFQPSSSALTPGQPLFGPGCVLTRRPRARGPALEAHLAAVSAEHADPLAAGLREPDPARDRRHPL